MKLRILTLFALLTLVLTGCISLAEDITPPPGFVAPTPAPTLAAVFPAAAPDINAGAAIYTEKCAPCHGLTGQGDGDQAVNLPVAVAPLGKAEFASQAAPARWYTVVTEGNIQKMMPPFASLTDQQRWDVVAYALSLSASAEQVQAGKALYEVNCAQCHGANGRQLPEADLASQETMAKLSNNDVAGLIQKGIQPGMPAIELAETDAANLVAYVRTFTFAASKQAAVTAPTPEPASGTPETSSSESAAPTSAATPEQPAGKISGQVSNGSGGPLPSGLKVTLHTFETDATSQHFVEGESRETTLSSSGDYQFDDIALTETAAYFVSIEVDGIIYESEPAIPAQDGLTEYVLPITIYETTTDASALSFANAHILYDYSLPGKIQVVEFFVVKNTGNKTVVSAQPGGAVLEIPLPTGYQNLQFEDGSTLGTGRFIQTATGFADTASIAPSNEQNPYSLVFAFDLPYEASTSPLTGIFGGNSFELSQKFNLRAESVSLLVPVGVKAKNPNFVDGGTQQMGGGFSFQLYKVGAIEAGQTFTSQVTGTPQESSTDTAPAAATGSTQNIIIGIGAFGVALILAGGFLYLRDRQARATAEAELDDDDEEELSEDEILDAIIALDDQYKAGNISAAAYQERRAELKSKLVIRNS